MDIGNTRAIRISAPPVRPENGVRIPGAVSKTVQRHIWKDYEELADDARYTPAYAQLYKRRKETIERVFADAKEKHAMRYTQYRGLAQVTNWVKLKFVAMNLKKIGHMEMEDLLSLFRFAVFSLIYVRDPVCS